MSKVYTHYGVRIEKKIGTIKNFIEYTRKNNMEYQILPILEVDVIKLNDAKFYIFDDHHECYYITEALPIDGNYTYLMNDIEYQEQGEKPFDMPLKFNMIIDKAWAEVSKTIREHYLSDDMQYRVDKWIKRLEKTDEFLNYDDEDDGYLSKEELIKQEAIREVQYEESLDWLWEKYGYHPQRLSLILENDKDKMQPHYYEAWKNRISELVSA